MPMWEAFVADAPAPLAALLGEVSASHRRVVVLYDLMNAFVAEEAARLPNGRGFGLHCTAVSTFLRQMNGVDRLLRERGLGYSSFHQFVTEEFLEFVGKRSRARETIRPSSGILMNTCRALEGEFIDFVSEQMAAGSKKVFSIGPLNPVLDGSVPEQGKERHECLEWLDKQLPASVIYVSFGFMSSLRDEQISELAAALRVCNYRFIWVLRDAVRANMFTGDGDSRHAKLLPEFTQETEGRGLVITGWAPQLEMLAHGATAAFLSHFGWNSTVESMSHRKSILAWPMHSDQPWDAELICKYFKAGFLVRPCEQHREVIPAARIREVFEKLMDSDEGRAVRQRATMLGEAVRVDAAVGGASNKNLEDFISHITR
jgi:cis-zeatin O-glucosyltransferase